MEQQTLKTECTNQPRLRTPKLRSYNRRLTLWWIKKFPLRSSYCMRKANLARIIAISVFAAATTLLVRNSKNVAAQSPSIATEPSLTAPPAIAPELTVTRAFDHYVVRGGWITWLLLIPLSVTALAVVIDCGIHIRRAAIMPEETVDALADLFGRGAYADAVRYVSEERSTLSRIVYAGMVEARNGYTAMEHGMEDAVDEQAARLSRKIEYLNIIGNVAPMVGLFGTVQGIIGMFVSIADAGGIPVMSRISNDLGTALVATYWGLLVAIPSLSVFGLMRNKIDALLAECAVMADRLMSVFRNESLSASAAAAAPQNTMTSPAVAVA